MTSDPMADGRPSDAASERAPSPGGGPRDHAAAHRPVRRSYSAPSGRRDVDRSEQTHDIRLLLYSLVPAGMFGIAGVLATGSLLGGLAGLVVGYGIVRGIVGGAGRAAGTLHNPSGRSTPHEREYSVAESFVVRGLLTEAVDAYETAIDENPDDATPRVRLARLYRDELEDPQSASRWFRRALDGPIRPGVASLVRRELVELYRNRLGQPRKAIPFLARWAEELHGTDDGAWAARELAELKAAMRSELGLADGAAPSADGSDPE